MRTAVLVLMLLIGQPLMAAESKDDARFKQCRKNLVKAQQFEILTDLDWKLPHEPKVVVGPTFFTMSFAMKERFASTLNCFLLGGKESGCVNFNVMHWQTGKVAGRFSYCKLEMT